jgi:hypothetical protein
MDADISAADRLATSLIIVSPGPSAFRVAPWIKPEK